MWNNLRDPGTAETESPTLEPLVTVAAGGIWCSPIAAVPVRTSRLPAEKTP